MKRLRVLVAALAAVVTIGAGPARAQSKAVKRPAAKAAPQRPQGSSQRPEKLAGPGAPKVLRLEEMKVEGRIRKPQAMFLLPRASLNAGDADRMEPLLPKVTKAVEREPF